MWKASIQNALILILLCGTYSWVSAQDHREIDDDISGLKAAYGLQNIVAEFSGDVVRVRRSSDNESRVIGLAGSRFERDAFEAFVGSDTAFVTHLFDQSGSGFDAYQKVRSHQPWIATGPDNFGALSVRGSQGMSLPDAYPLISGAREFTIFLPARWDGSYAEDNLYLLNATRYTTGNRPMGLFLERPANDRLAGRPTAHIYLSDGSHVELAADGTFGRAGVFEIHELVFDSDRTVSLYNSGRLVDSDTLRGRSVEQPEPYGDGLYFGSNAQYNAGFRGQFMPPLIFDRALTAGERTEVREALVQTYGVGTPQNSPPTGDEFTFVYLPDTQRYAGGVEGAKPETIQKVMDWIRENRSSWNIEMVFHPGDVVDAGFNEDMWKRANNWFGTLDRADIPYAVVPGNHDYQGPLNNRNSSNYNKYFSTSRFTSTDWWNGVFYEEGKTDNYYFMRHIGGEDYLIVGLELQPRGEVIQWANEVLQNHPDKKAVILTHDFMNESGRFSGHMLIDQNANSGQELYRDLLSEHDNIYLVLGGHHGLGSARRIDRSTGAHYMFFDPMFLDWGNEGAIRLLVVSPENGTIRAMTYSPAADEFRSDYENLFTFNTEPATTTGQEENPSSSTPEHFRLAQNYPNPFNTTTQITYSLAEGRQTNIAVYDLLGRKVRQMVQDYRNAGTHTVQFDASDLPTGLYIYRMEAGSFRQSRPMMVVK